MNTNTLRRSILFLLVAVNSLIHAQRIDYVSTFRQLPSNEYLRIYYDNDFFTKTDYYYTQGITFVYANPVLRKNPVNRILIKPGNADIEYGISFNLFGYTPTSIKSDLILIGDRPFDANLAFNSFLAGSDTVRSQKLSTSLLLGVMGPAALGREIQTTIHRWTGNDIPKGWQHQIRNDVIMSYEVNFEKKIAGDGNHFLLNATGRLRAGTLYNNLSSGINWMIGWFDDPYSNQRTRKLSLYFFSQTRANLIGYDATMQGGLFNRKSPYTIASSEIRRLTFQADAGIVINTGHLNFCYSQSYLTREFDMGQYHRWGGLSMGIGF